MDQAQQRSAPPRTDQVISEERFQRYHAYARQRGVNWPLYLLARLILQPAFLVWLRLSRVGREHVRGVKGGLIVASNHRSFLDPFVIAVTLPWRRPMQYVAKVELFERPWRGWILSRVGAFPIRRGQSDETAMETARLVLNRGGTVCIFPEGTRIRSGSLGSPRRGVGRLALETGAAVVPVGSARDRAGSARLADSAPQGEAARRQAGHVSTYRASFAGARRHGYRPDLAERRAPVGVARRPASVAQGGGDRGRGAGAPRWQCCWRVAGSRSSSEPARRRRPPRLPPNA